MGQPSGILNSSQSDAIILDRGRILFFGVGFYHLARGIHFCPVGCFESVSRRAVLRIARSRGSHDMILNPRLKRIGGQCWFRMAVNYIAAGSVAAGSGNDNMRRIAP